MSDGPDEAHILVVDDDARLRGLLSRYLAEHGFRVTTAENAAEARGKLRFVQPDLMVLDVMMPGETGLELTESLRARADRRADPAADRARRAGGPHRRASRPAPTTTSASRSSRASWCCASARMLRRAAPPPPRRDSRPARCSSAR